MTSTDYVVFIKTVAFIGNVRIFSKYIKICKFVKHSYGTTIDSAKTTALDANGYYSTLCSTFGDSSKFPQIKTNSKIHLITSEEILNSLRSKEF